MKPLEDRLRSVRTLDQSVNSLCAEAADEIGKLRIVAAAEGKAKTIVVEARDGMVIVTGPVEAQEEALAKIAGNVIRLGVTASASKAGGPG